MHLSREQVTDYLAGFLDAGAWEEVEEHLFSCHECATEAEFFFGLAGELRRALPPVLTAERFASLDREGRIEQVNTMSPGEQAEVRYPQAGKLLVHRLHGADLARAERVDLELTDLDGNTLVRYADVPFDPDRGEILVACQRHYADLFPRDGIFCVEAVTADGTETAGRFTVLHRL